MTTNSGEGLRTDTVGPHREQGRTVHLTAARLLIAVAALASFVLSVSLWFSGNESEGLYVGLWVPSILSLGAFIAPARQKP
jgi:hypothetical protein